MTVAERFDHIILGSFALLAWSYDDNCSMWFGYGV